MPPIFRSFKGRLRFGENFRIVENNIEFEFSLKFSIRLFIYFSREVTFAPPGLRLCIVVQWFVVFRYFVFAKL